jgi:hypothetical protein
MDTSEDFEELTIIRVCVEVLKTLLGTPQHGSGFHREDGSCFETQRLQAWMQCIVTQI